MPHTGEEGDSNQETQSSCSCSENSSPALRSSDYKTETVDTSATTNMLIGAVCLECFKK